MGKVVYVSDGGGGGPLGLGVLGFTTSPPLGNDDLPKCRPLRNFQRLPGGGTFGAFLG